MRNWDSYPKQSEGQFSLQRFFRSPLTALPITPEYWPQLGQVPVLQHRVETVLQLVILKTETMY